MASLTLKKDCKNWIACFGRTQRCTGIPHNGDKKVAQKIADEFEEASRLAKSGMFNEARARKVLNDILERAGQDKLHTDTVEVFLNDWLKGKDNAGTNERYTHTVELFLENLGERSKDYLSNISHKDIQRFVDSRKGYAPATVRIDVKTLNIPFALAKKLHFIQDNPVEKALALFPIKGGSMEKLPFSHQQVVAILNTAQEEWRTVILFGYGKTN